MQLRKLFLSASLFVFATLSAIGQSGTWSVTGSMAHARSGQGTAVLQNGSVLVVGGWNLAVVEATAEVYSPTTGTWTGTGSVNLARYGAPAVTLPNGKVLFAGGCVNNCNDITSSAELFDPATGTWSYTGSLHTPRYFYTAVLLNTGKVLVAGGCNAASCNTVTATAELYDPSTGAFSTTGPLSVARDYQAAALLANGNVLVAGGFGTTGTLTQAEVYNPSTGRWTSAGNMATGRSQHTATLLPNGKVLVAGGLSPLGAKLASAELYNPANNSWTATGNLTDKRYNHTATLLSTGKVLIAAGTGQPKRAAVKLASSELYDPATGTFSATGILSTGRTQHTAAKLQNGKVLAIGGLGANGYLTSTELYVP
jgi:large repetitive protein